MQIKFFTIPILDVQSQEQEVNAFLRAHKLLEVHRELVRTETGAYWCLYVAYLESGGQIKESKKKVDYKNELPPAQFAVFSDLRKARLAIAKAENLSAFLIFTDAELAKMAKLSELSPTAIAAIKGIGKAKQEKYVVRLLEEYKQLQNEKKQTNETSR